MNHQGGRSNHSGNHADRDECKRSESEMDEFGNGAAIMKGKSEVSSTPFVQRLQVTQSLSESAKSGVWIDGTSPRPVSVGNNGTGAFPVIQVREFMEEIPTTGRCGNLAKVSSFELELDEELNDEEEEEKEDVDGKGPRVYANRPHPSLEYPPLYFLLKSSFPSLFANIKGAYEWRWKMSYPLQARVPLTRQLRKLRIHLTWGELIFLLPFFVGIVLGLLYTIVDPSVSGTGQVCRIALIAAVVLAQRNSLVTLFLGMPVDRTMFYHKLAGRLAFVTCIMHTAAFYLVADQHNQQEQRHLGQHGQHDGDHDGEHDGRFSQFDTHRRNHAHARPEYEVDFDDFISSADDIPKESSTSNSTEGAGVGAGSSIISATLASPGYLLWHDQVCIAGSVMFILLTIILITSLPLIRRRLFELFYIVHLVSVIGLVAGAFFHTGILVPVLTLATWGVDLWMRHIVMARHRYPQEATLQVISDSVVQISFPKTQGFDYNPGQYIYIALPEISWLEWHPFSISSSPKQRNVTLHVRKAGDWTNALHNLGKKESIVPIMIEGPYGSLGINMLTGDRYKMILLVSGGIGITPMQSLCDQLLHEQAKGRRNLKRLRFVWTERDPVMMRQADFVRRASFVAQRSQSTLHMNDSSQIALPNDGGKILRNLSMHDSDSSSNMATRILAHIPPGRETDDDLARIYASAELSLERDMANDHRNEDDVDVDNGHEPDDEKNHEKNKDDESHRSGETSLATEDPNNPWEKRQGIKQENSNNCCVRRRSTIDEVLDVQVYLSSTRVPLPPTNVMSFPSQTQVGRPNIRQIFALMKEEAVAQGECRVAVCVCAPQKLVDLCQKACIVYSDTSRGVGTVQFDFHSEPTAT